MALGADIASVFVPCAAGAGMLVRAGAHVDDVADVAGFGRKVWGRADTLDDHFRRHGSDFGARSAGEYADIASQFFQRSQRERLPTKIDADGVIRVYDPATNTFGAFNPDGTTRTLFKPTRTDYWSRQPGDVPWMP
jgi:pyocin large subunit-like protein